MSGLVVSSFNGSCSNSFSCINPLICSNISKCICSKSSSFWNNEQNDCLYCLPGWIKWRNNRCLSFSVPAEGGLSYNQAKNICYSLTGELFHLYDVEEFKQFELHVRTLLNSAFSSAVTIFFRLGAWINEFNSNFIVHIII